MMRSHGLALFHKGDNFISLLVKILINNKSVKKVVMIYNIIELIHNTNSLHHVLSIQYNLC